jgi:hypothetical protein
MRISRIGPRQIILSLAFPLACAIATTGAAQTAPQGDVYSSGGGGEFRGIIVSITPNGINTVDVKLQDPVTHYIHSVTVMVDVIKDQGLTKGERVTQYKDPETGEPMLAPTMMSGSGQPLPGQANDTGAASNPPGGGTNPAPPPDNPDTGGTPDTGSPPSYPPPVTNPPPPYTGGASAGPPPSYPAPKMVGNLTGSGTVNGIPVTIGGGGPNTTPVPAGSPPGTPITASNQSGQGNWKLFSGTLMTDGMGNYVQFTQGYYQGYVNGQLRQGWFPITPQNVRLNTTY